MVNLSKILHYKYLISTTKKALRLSDINIVSTYRHSIHLKANAFNYSPSYKQKKKQELHKVNN